MRWMVRLAPILTACIIGLALLITPGLLTRGRTVPVAQGSAVMNRQAFHDEMRSLWAGDHIVWTRCFIISAGTLPSNLPDISATTDRLLFNQTEIGNAIKPFYGTDAGNALTSLLRSHILIAAQLITDAKAGNTSAVASDETAWYANADQIATFLSGANPKNWTFKQLQSLLDQHLKLTTDEALARLAGNYTGDISAYDSVHGEILQLADTLSAGIIAQFPQDFSW